MRKLDMLDVSWILLIIEALGSMVFGVVFAVLGSPSFILEYIGMEWSEIVVLSPLLASSFELAQRLLGYAHISIALASLIVLKRYYRKGQRWALLFIFTLKMPVWPPAWFLIPPAIQIAFWGTIALSVLWLLGIIIGARVTLKTRQLG
ncbi:MAG: hypothetical protein ACXABV_14360 [Candidatus Thorarchaeota archaeon]|jgi:hypothetical protein